MDKESFVNKNKVIIISMIAIILLLVITVSISYSFYKTVSSETVIGGKVGNIPNIRILVENKDSDGLKQGTYSRSYYIPKNGYIYNTEKSYCKNGASITYDDATNTLTSSNNGDTCFAYFDATIESKADITLNIFIPSEYSSTGYKQVNEIPNDKAYTLNNSKSSCTNSGFMIYSDGKIKISASTPGTVCNAYLD